MAIQRFGNAALKDIRVFEAKYNINLPSDYVDFLLKYNGGGVDFTGTNSLHVEEFGGEINVDVLFGLGTEDAELSIEFWSKKYRDEMPHDTIIIGDSYQHGFIVMVCSGNDAGVYYWDDTYHFPCSNDKNNTYFIADTFTDFIKGLL